MKHILTILSTLLILQLFAQKQSTLYIKGGEKLLVTQVKKLLKETSFYYKDSLQQNTKASLPNWLVDSIVLGKIDTTKSSITTAPSSIIAIDTATRIATDTQPAIQQAESKQKNGHFTWAIGLTLGNFLEFNNPTAADKKGFSFTASLDLNYKYQKPNSSFTMSHELHYIFGVQKEALTASKNLQRVQDDLATLHDISFKISKKQKWNVNLIAKTNTSLFTIYDGDYFQDVTGLGKVKGFASPYSISLAPGFKYDASNALKISISPYSFEMYGIKNTEISNKGIYITDVDATGNFKKAIIRKQGMEINIWFDKNLKEWLEMQYRLSINSDYAGGLANNGVIDGLFITRAKIFKSIYLTHRATLYNSLTGNLLKPFFTQTVLLSYSKSL